MVEVSLGRSDPMKGGSKTDAEGTAKEGGTRTVGGAVGRREVGKWRVESEKG
jgi:hypothetical protein